MFSILFLVTLKASVLLPIAIGAAGGMSLLGNLIGSSNTNTTNAEIARMNNEFNAEQNTLAFQRNLMAWNLQNAYNTPANQVARLKAAGLSPYLAYSQMSSGNAGAINVPSPVQAQSYTYRSPLEAVGQFFGNIVPTVISALSQAEDFKQKKVDTEIKEKTAPDVIDQVHQQTTLGNWNLNVKEYESEMQRLRRDILEKYGMSDAEYNQQLIRSRIAAMTYDKQKSLEDLLRMRYENSYYSRYGYRGERDYMGQIVGANSTGGALLRALGGVGRATGLDSKLLGLIRQFIGF